MTLEFIKHSTAAVVKVMLPGDFVAMVKLGNDTTPAQGVFIEVSRYIESQQKLTSRDQDDGHDSAGLYCIVFISTKNQSDLSFAYSHWK